MLGVCLALFLQLAIVDTFLSLLVGRSSCVCGLRCNTGSAACACKENQTTRTAEAWSATTSALSAKISRESKMTSDPSCRNAGEVTIREAMVRNESTAAAESLTISEVEVLEVGPSVGGGNMSDGIQTGGA